MISLANSRGNLVLALGDLVAYTFSLIMALTVRYSAIPGRTLLLGHFLPSFAILFCVFLLINFSAGLYDKNSVFFRSRVHGLILKSQAISAAVGVMFFYFAPVVIAPKANLFIFFIISTFCLWLWRVIMFPVVSSVRSQPAVILGASSDIQDLMTEVNGRPRYGLFFDASIAPSNNAEQTAKAVTDALRQSKATMLIADLGNPSVEAAMPSLYSMIFSGIKIIDANKLYEGVFDRIPLSLVGERWLIENTGAVLGNHHVYDALKRIMDVAIAIVLGIISLIAYPFVWAAIKMEDRGSIFITQDRIGKNGKAIRIIKFRSMSGNDEGKYGANGATKHRITKIGKVIRTSRIDELPQLWNVLKGDLSLIGPRPELPSLVAVYEKEIPYYNARHLVKPGLSGWAQIYHEAHPHHAVATEETSGKLSYDLFYIKNRSFMLDLKIALRTMQILLGRSGR